MSRFKFVAKNWAFVFVGVILIATAASTMAAVAATNPPSPKVQQYIKQGFRPSTCDVTRPGMHRCNLVVPVDTQGNPMHAATYNAAKQLRRNSGATPKNKKAFSGVYSPQQLHTAYQLPCKPGGPVQGTCSQPVSFGPNTIAIVDAGGYRGPGSIEGNLATFDQQYGLPSCTKANGCLKIVNGSGQTSPLPAPLPVNDNWDIEMDLDVQTAHMICQTCKILLVQSDDDSNSLNDAVPVAASFNPIAISLSWGGSNFPPANADFQFKGIAVVAASGDSGSDEANGYPADLAEVIDAAGTSLNLNANNTWSSETVWSDSGGGCALNGFDAPAWQTSLPEWSTAGCGQNKADGDMSAMADPNPGVATYSDGQWMFGGGTSLSSPIVAASIALAGRVPNNQYGSQYIYQNADSSNTHDITLGNNCTATATTHCTAAVGFDEPSGLGSFKGLGLFGDYHGGASYGDFNNDGNVNITDLSVILSHFHLNVTQSLGDVNGDGTVTITDLSIFITDWTG
ncbi:MAG TPA: dockerin type I domain-containing protein [Candidatus Saccharimonadales bacterium]|nr:dockerin type I domain-containing protein [Candidatus Saccharimonadales bacterium]